MLKSIIADFLKEARLQHSSPNDLNANRVVPPTQIAFQNQINGMDKPHIIKNHQATKNEKKKKGKIK